MAKVLLKNVTKRFGEVLAVNQLSLEVKDKEFMILLGPSGCGKTTALRCIAGLETPEEGEIYIGNRLVNDLDPKERDIAMVFQSYALYPHMTVFKNLAFPLENARVPKEEIKNKVQEVAELLRIEMLLDRKPKQLSGGQRQRVALGRAMVREPHVFLMDEPLSNLDAKLRIYMRAELKKLQRELGITTIYVTHDQIEAMTMGDRIAILNEGLLQQTGIPNEVYFDPSNLFVAGFIGSPPMNFFDCTLKGDILDAGAFLYVLSKDLAKAIEGATSDRLVLGVRPQDILVYREAKSEKNTMEAQVDMIEPLGETSIIDFKVGKYLFKTIVSPDFQAEVGDKFLVIFPEEKLHIFDKKIGKKIV